MSDQMGGPQPGSGERAAERTRNVPLYQPVTEIYETKDALVLSLEMPGVESDAVSITLDKRVLTVTGHSVAKPPEGYALIHSEYRDGDYERSFTLSEAIDGDRIEAAMRDGVLRLVLPKAQPAPAKTISVKAT
jgi:HSP20 family molecular chaperone IbpA